MTLKFNRVLEVVEVHVRASSVQRSWVFVSANVFALSRNGKESENPVLWPWLLTYDLEILWVCSGCRNTCSSRISPSCVQRFVSYRANRNKNDRKRWRRYRGRQKEIEVWRWYVSNSDLDPEANSYSPEVAEPLDELGGVVLVELDVREVIFEDGWARISDVEEHELGFAQVHRCQRTGVYTLLVKFHFDVTLLHSSLISSILYSVVHKNVPLCFGP